MVGDASGSHSDTQSLSSISMESDSDGAAPNHAERPTKSTRKLSVDVPQRRGAATRSRRNVNGHSSARMQPALEMSDGTDGTNKHTPRRSSRIANGGTSYKVSDDEDEALEPEDPESGDDYVEKAEAGEEEDRETNNDDDPDEGGESDAPLIQISRTPLAQRSTNTTTTVAGTTTSTPAPSKKSTPTADRKRKRSDGDITSPVLAKKPAARGRTRKGTLKNAPENHEESSDADAVVRADPDEANAVTASPRTAKRTPAKRSAPKRAAPRRKSKSDMMDVDASEAESDEGPSSAKKPRRRARASVTKKNNATRRRNKSKQSDEDAGSEFHDDEEDDSNDDEDDDDDDAVREDESAAGPSRIGSTRGRARGGMSRSQREAARVTSMGDRLAARVKKEWEEIYQHHPQLETIWDELEKSVATIEMKEAEQPEKVLVKLLPFQRKGVYWLRMQEESEFNGGILADEMGMGKTIQTIGLLVSTPHVRPNLIVAPTVALLQWQSELCERTQPGTFSIYIFHGHSRTKSSDVDFSQYDVVLTTYATLESAFRRHTYGTKTKIKNAKKESESDEEFDEDESDVAQDKKRRSNMDKGKQPMHHPTQTHKFVKTPSVLHCIKWGRIILDEAHSIKDRSCSTARAVFALQSDRRWSLTGTPLQNRVGEIYSLIRFMDADPFSYYMCKNCPCKLQSWSFKNGSKCDSCGHTSHRHFCWWNMAILKPIQRYGARGDGVEAFKKLRLLLDRIMLRRTKIEHADDLGLPPRVVVVRRDVFNEPEEEFYESLYSDSRREFNTYVAANTVLNNYASIFSLLSRMRLAANHPDLVVTKLAISNNTAKETLVCGICQEPAEDAVVSKCKHIFCREDIRQYIQTDPDSQPKCPVCFKSLTIDLSQPTVESLGASNSQTSIVNHIDMSRWRSSTKIEALVEELEKLQRDEGGGATIKSIVFSQFVSFLDLVAWRLARAGIVAVKLDGRMGPEQRQAVIDSFMKDPNVTVFLVSLKAGGVALNLTEASRVFVCDPWWNGSVEDQAFDRIHRLGQYRPIKITRLIIENSIESRILQLQEKKKALIASTVGKDMDALAKLSEEDLRFLFLL